LCATKIKEDFSATTPKIYFMSFYVKKKKLLERHFLEKCNFSQY